MTMKQFIAFLALLFPISGCELGHSPHEPPGGFQPSGGFQITFRLLDTTGVPTSKFQAGESFDMEFVIRNLSGMDQSFHYTGPAVVFDILSADTVLCTSVDGLAFPQVLLGGILHNGESYRATWRAPNSPGRRPPISLAPGTYVARAHHGAFFDHTRIPSTNTTPFTVQP